MMSIYKVSTYWLSSCCWAVLWSAGCYEHWDRFVVFLLHIYDRKITIGTALFFSRIVEFRIKGTCSAPCTKLQEQTRKTGKFYIQKQKICIVHRISNIYIVVTIAHLTLCSWFVRIDSQYFFIYYYLEILLSLVSYFLINSSKYLYR